MIAAMLCTSQIISHSRTTENAVAKIVAEIMILEGASSLCIAIAASDASIVTTRLHVECLRTVLISLLLVG